MDLHRTAPTLGVLASLALVLVLLAPFLLVTGQQGDLGAYYGAGPVGVSGVGFLALLAVIVFLSGLQGRSPPDLVAGITLALGLVMLGLALLWATAIDPTVLFSFPPEYDWLATHRWVVVAGAAVVAVSATLYSRAAL